MKCIECGFENDADAKFCEHCGHALTRYCPKCNSPIKPGASFCKNCGAAVTQGLNARASKERLSALQQSAPVELQEKIRTSSAQIRGERKPVTILFTDIVGSTSLAEKLDPEEWKEIVSAAHRRISQAVYKYEGTIAQLLGDGVLAFFGAPITHEDDPIRAVHAALDIQQEIEKYANELRGYVDNFQLRVGLNTGTVVVGNVGSDLHMEYLAIGDAVNVAARLQSAAQPGKVLISASTARNVKAIFNLQTMGQITVKGKAEPVTVFEVANRKAVPGHTRGFMELSSPLVGRERELGCCTGVLESVLSGHGQILAIIGEAGIGKSRLTEELQQINASHPVQAHWIEGRALSYGHTLSFWTINQLLYSDLRLSDGDPEVKVRSALKRRLSSLFGEKDVEVLPYLEHLLGVQLEGAGVEQVRSLDGETLRQQILVAIGRYFRRLAELQPTVAVFEDLHWADPSSLEALEALMAVTDRAPLMLVLLARLEREHGSWRTKLKAETDYAHRYTEILLKPLSSGEQNRMVDNLLAIADLPESTRRLIFEHAEGNPFYLEEIIRSLIDQGAIVHVADKWNATEDLSDLVIPETLEGVLLARIDRLQEDVRRTLQISSVIGKSFLYRLLEAIAKAEQQLDQQLAQLQRVDLVREKNRLPELEYIFKHSLTQEAAYNSLLIEQRREFHHKVGEALENLFSDRIEQHLGLLAYHFEAAGDAEKAVGYLIQAGDQARLTDEHTEAIAYYQRAVKLLEERHEEARLAQVWLKLGMIYNTNFQFEAAHQANENAFSIRAKIPSPERTAKAYEPSVFRFGIRGGHVTLDPGLASWQQDVCAVTHLFSGLARINSELDVEPDIARSWQVMDGGKRYVFNLRDDVVWSDGAQITAHDVEWSWKRNLRPELHSFCAGYLYDLVGAWEFHQGINQDPSSIGVRALDQLTLEVHLEQPVAYFPFIITMPITYPLPRKCIDKYGKNWWHPETIISSGPYKLEMFDAHHRCRVVRNNTYYGEFSGNAEQVEWIIAEEEEELLNQYLEGNLDCFLYRLMKDMEMIPPECKHMHASLGVAYMVFSPGKPPFNDPRVRKAFALAVDRQMLSKKFNSSLCRGGMVPPGMPGHSPDINLPYDVPLARKLLAEAGYPGGEGFPITSGLGPAGWTKIAEILTQQWYDALGVKILLEGASGENLTEWIDKDPSHSTICMAWTADYPDPDNFLWKCDAIHQLKRLGWQDPDYDHLLEEASRTPDRVKRLAMYRQADYQLVNEQALVIPFNYPTQKYILSPRVKYISKNPIGFFYLEKLIIKD